MSQYMTHCIINYIYNTVRHGCQCTINFVIQIPHSAFIIHHFPYLGEDKIPNLGDDLATRPFMLELRMEVPNMAQANQTQDTNATSVALAGHLFLTHFLAAGAGLLAWNWLAAAELPPRLAFSWA